MHEPAAATPSGQQPAATPNGKQPAAAAATEKHKKQPAAAAEKGQIAQKEGSFVGIPDRSLNSLSLSIAPMKAGQSLAWSPYLRNHN